MNLPELPLPAVPPMAWFIFLWIGVTLGLTLWKVLAAPLLGYHDFEEEDKKG